VSDADGKTDASTQDIILSEVPSGGLTLTARGYKVRGIRKVDLEWSGSNATSIEIFRNGLSIKSTENDGFYTDELGRVSGTFTYQISDGSSESNEASVTF
jgi:hypothetical protein